MNMEEIRGLFNGIPEIDFNIGYRYFLGNIDNYTKALMATLKSIKSKLSLLQMMSNSQEYEGLRLVTQTFRTMLSNIGAVEVSEATYQLEVALLNEDRGYLIRNLTGYIYSLSELAENLEVLLKEMNMKGSTKELQESSYFQRRDFSKTIEGIKRSEEFIIKKII